MGHDGDALHTTKVFAKAGLDNETSAMCYYQLRFGLDVQCSAFIFNFNKIFSIGHLFRAGHSMNSLPSQILNVVRKPKMTHRKIIPLLIVISLTLAFISCKTSPKQTFSLSSLDMTIKTTKISISDLAKNYKSYQGQYIETTGRFYQGFEEFAIYTEKNIFTGEAKGFWLGTDQNLKIDNTSFEKMYGKRVTIKGRIDTTAKGHLSSYLATIGKIYFWQQQ